MNRNIKNTYPYGLSIAIQTMVSQYIKKPVVWSAQATKAKTQDSRDLIESVYGCKVKAGS
jgi:hypothetical protein